MITTHSPSSVFFRLALLLALAGAAGAPAPAAAQAQNERPPATKGPLEWHPEALKAIGPAAVTLALAEGLDAHAQSVAIRLNMPLDK